MFNAIKNFFEVNIDSDTSGDLDYQLKLATAALLLEMMHQDHNVNEKEKRAVREALRENFNLNDDETQELIKLAKQEASEATDYFQFTSLIAKEYPQEDKIKVVEYLWKIAYADTYLDPLEEHMIRRIADLLYVPHREFIRTKHRVARNIGDQKAETRNQESENKN